MNSRAEPAPPNDGGSGEMECFIVIRREGWTTPSQIRHAVGRALEAAEQMVDAIRLVRSYMVLENDGTFALVSICESPTRELVEEHAQRAGLPAGEVMIVADVLVTSEDPALR
jgi:hypothetical protein